MNRPKTPRERRARQFAVATVFAAVCFTAAPLCLLLAFQLTGDDGESDRLLSDLSEVAAGTFRPAESTSSLRDMTDHDAKSEAASSIVRKSSPVPKPTVRIAQAVSPERPDAKPSTTTEAESVVSAEPQTAEPDFADLPESLRPPGITPPAILTRPGEIAVAETPQDDSAAEFEIPIEEIEKKIAPEVVPSTFGATGHLAVAGMEPAETGKPQKSAKEAKTAEDDDDPPQRASKRRRRRSRGNNDDAKTAVADRGKPLTAPSRALPPSADEPPTVEVGPTVEVVLQTPLERMQVHRVENVIGVTRAAGWPVILIRSDLPDDLWWVQQLVSAGGNTFSGRVNFGNEDSVSGSVYHMVVVFLDSADEMRRFRIAKQFKELPEGIRHSRKFTFVRR